jgi:hypothetical protein
MLKGCDVPDIILKGFETKKEFLKRYLLLFVALMFLGGNAFGESTQQWKTYEYKAFWFSIQSPFKLEASESSGREQIILSAFSDDKRTRISLTSTMLKDKFANVKLDDIPKIMSKNFIKINKDWFDLEYKTKATICSNLPAKLTRYTFLYQGKKAMKIMALDVLGGSTWWEVHVVYHADDIKAEKIAERAINSFRILK